MAASVVKVPAIPTSARLEPSAENAAAMGASATIHGGSHGGEFRSAHRIRMQITLGQAHRTDIDACGARHTALVAKNKLRAAAADIDDQEFTAEQRQTALHGEKGICRFFGAGNHADVDAKFIKNPCPHCRAILSIAQRAGADGSDRLDAEIVTTIAVLAKDRRRRALHRRRRSCRSHRRPDPSRRFRPNHPARESGRCLGYRQSGKESYWCRRR